MWHPQNFSFAGIQGELNTMSNGSIIQELINIKVEAFKAHPLMYKGRLHISML